VECKANRQRLISLAADVVGFRRQIERLDEADVSTFGRRLERTELLLVGILAYLITGAIIDARREMTRG
jgi:hypothetical protein